MNIIKGKRCGKNATEYAARLTVEKKRVMCEEWSGDNIKCTRNKGHLGVHTDEEVWWGIG